MAKEPCKKGGNCAIEFPLARIVQKDVKRKEVRWRGPCRKCGKTIEWVIGEKPEPKGKKRGWSQLALTGEDSAKKSPGKG